MGKDMLSGSQTELAGTPGYGELDKYFSARGIRRIFLVCGRSFSHMKIKRYFGGLSSRLGISVAYFTDFQPNPEYSAIVRGIGEFRRSGADAIVAVGGGSAMDVAKCVKLYHDADISGNLLAQDVCASDIPFLAIPTTAGSGSESTRFAVIYQDGTKRSVNGLGILPDAILLDGSLLETLPGYQRKSAMLDALCHAIESFWSVNSTEESRGYSRQAIEMIMGNYQGCLANGEKGNADMLRAANLAGRAINIAETTAGHAMCYKLTGLYGIAHGHAAAMCVLKLWPFMLENPGRCIDPRGIGFLDGIYGEIASAMGCADAWAAVDKFSEIYQGFKMETPKARAGDYGILKGAVNPVRLKNHPILLDEAVIEGLYCQILG